MQMSHLKSDANALYERTLKLTDLLCYFRLYDPHSKLDLLRVQLISQAQAWQRTGRAGREAPGTCYRLYTEQDFETFRKNTQPEIQRYATEGCLTMRVYILNIVNGLLSVTSTNRSNFFSRCNLSSVVLQMLAMGIKDLVNFDFLDKPSPQVRAHLQ